MRSYRWAPLNTSGLSVAGRSVETEAGAESLRSVVLTVVLKLEHQNHQEDLIKHRFPGRTPDFLTLEPRNLHF